MIPENYGNKNYFYIYIDNHIIIIYIKNKKWVFSSKVLKSERVARFFFMSIISYKYIFPSFAWRIIKEQ